MKHIPREKKEDLLVQKVFLESNVENNKLALVIDHSIKEFKEEMVK